MAPSNNRSSGQKAPGGRCQGGVDGPGLGNGDLEGHLSLDGSQRAWGRQSIGEACALDAQRHVVTHGTLSLGAGRVAPQLELGAERAGCPALCLA